MRNDPDIRGRKGLPNRKKVRYKKHRKIHEGPGGGEYNERFKEEIEKKGGFDKVKKKDILEIRDKLVKEFGLDKE